MTDAAFDPVAFSGEVPLFPLPKLVLFPHAMLPLHIFEPRYRAMMEAVLAGEGLIAMALLKPGWEPDYYGNPAIYDVVGVGKVVEHVRLPDGRFNLVLSGVSRARVIGEVSRDPFRIARVELLHDRPADGTALEEIRLELAGYFADQLSNVGSLPLGALCDVLVSLIPFEAPVKQGFLEELDAGVRARRLVEMLRALKASPKKPFGDPSLN